MNTKIILSYFSLHAVWGTLALPSSAKSTGCKGKYFGFDSIVCVCTASHCDQLSPLVIGGAEFLQITTSKARKRWQQEKRFPSTFNYNFGDGKPDFVLRVNTTQSFQKIRGFGGAFTDAAGFNLRKLSPELQDTILKSYFDLHGLEYNLGRVPIGGTDFSTRPYSYDDLPRGQTDQELKHFRIAKEDLAFKIPYILKAQLLCKQRGKSLGLFSSPWSAPAWMKDSQSIKGKGKLLKKYYSAWAKYFVMFFEFYRSKGIEFFSTTAQNEPTTGFVKNYPFNTMGWLPHEQGVWVGNFLGPELQKAGFGNISVFIGDDSRYILPGWVTKTLAAPRAKEFVGGVALHWYWDFLTSTELLETTHEKFPNLPILYTEACTGDKPWDFIKVILGSWARAEFYAADIIENLNHWVVGWTDWNLVLDREGGPNWVKNFVDSPIIVDHDKDEAYRQPMFYALAHFSKVFAEGSERLNVTTEEPSDASLLYTGFLRPDGVVALTILNRNIHQVEILLKINESHEEMFILDARSITTIAWKDQQVQNWIH